ncbi:ParA family protein [Candidatus Methanoperedens nitratireducens]|uniref:Putative Cobyrinic acid ac-diamide synthase n=1 Tax=Candidatus Methanoperedens nitratireducens TaxID=1392998 RepID=A0A284VU01_9EURY|nr:ParA family protein [Candidatus Methanoperedens nitroreducens]SNQ62752.1 putative Cobyrinic acid ac-diamide synthase [Candidatus Methanoperedens nitroreducens]
MPNIKVISFVNMKGGVAKTTLTANVGWALTHFHSKNVLMIDVDMQANLSQYFMKPQDYADLVNREGSFKDKLTVMAVYQKRNLTTPSTVRESGNKTEIPKLNLKNLKQTIYSKDGAVLDLIPSTLELVDLDPTNADNRLKIFLNEVRDKYHYLLIDCPPTMYFFTKSALIASDAYLIPVKPDHLSSFGFILLERVIKQFESDYEKKLIQLGTVFTLVEGKETNLMRDTMRNMRKLSDRYFFNQVFHHSTKVAEAAKYNKTLFEYPPAERYADEIKIITDDLIRKIKEVENNG